LDWRGDDAIVQTENRSQHTRQAIHQQHSQQQPITHTINP